MFRLCWFGIYLGPLEIVAHIAGKNFISRAFNEHATTFAVSLKTITIEVPQSMSTTENYQYPAQKV